VSKRRGAFRFAYAPPGVSSGRSGLCAVIVIIAAALLLLDESPAGATVPGVNGDLAYETAVPPGVGVTTPTGDVQMLPGLADTGGRVSDPAWSSNGTRLAFTATRAGSADTDIYSAARNGRDVRRLTFDPAPDAGASWSPDGSSIAFESTRDGDADIYVASADGTAVRRLTTAPGVDEDPAWSPDGRFIAFDSARGGSFELYVMAADGGAQTRLTFGPLPDRDPSWSPDGRQIAFVSGVAPQTDLFAIGSRGGRVRRLTTNPATDESPVWSPDGRQLAFSSNRGGAKVFSLYVMNAAGAPEIGLHALGVRGRNPDWAPLPPPAAVPTHGRTANATATGKVLVQVPGARSFTALTSPREIPLGTRFDTRHGSVKLTTALPKLRTAVTPGKSTSTTTASRGIFVLSQTATTTDLTLSLPRCPSARTSAARHLPPPDSTTLKVKVRSTRHYPVRVKGQYQIGGSVSTVWTTTNRCSRTRAGTSVHVIDGAVRVHDLPTKRVFVVGSRRAAREHPGRFQVVGRHSIAVATG